MYVDVRCIGVRKKSLNPLVNLHTSDDLCIDQHGMTARNGQQSTLRPFVNDLTKKKRARIQLQLVLWENCCRKTNYLGWRFGVSHDVLSNSLARGETELLSVLRFPFRVRTHISLQTILDPSTVLVGEIVEGNNPRSLRNLASCRSYVPSLSTPLSYQRHAFQPILRNCLTNNLRGPLHDVE
jgi:hypothetical protein